MTPRADVIVIGGGIAGLSTAWALARAGARRVHLIEREPTLASHASGRNAGILRHIDDDALSATLAVRSRQLLATLAVDAAPMRRTGALFLGGAARLQRMAVLAAQVDVACETLEATSLRRAMPLLECNDGVAGLLVHDDGVLDVHAVVLAVAREARGAGVKIDTSGEVQAIVTRDGRIEGVRMVDGVIRAGAVVIAAGAWASALGSACGAPLPLESRRRHLALLVPDQKVEREMPVVWRLDQEVYFRPESGAVLASPCDEDVWPAEVPPCSVAALELLAERLACSAPMLATAAVRRSWACLRTFVPDRGLATGADPRVRGLFWLAGLGGRGMTCGLAAGELAADALLGIAHPLASATSVGRLLR